jgi:nucleoside-diphosphate-sugar epimerase
LDNYRWVAASLGLLRAFADAGGTRVVAIGTGAEYDWSAGVCSGGVCSAGVCSESTTPLRPTSTYGLCKRALSELFVDFTSRDDVALTGAWARLFFLYGPHEHPKRLIAWVITQLLAGEVAPCSHGRQQRDYLCVLDAANALVSLLAARSREPSMWHRAKPWHWVT